MTDPARARRPARWGAVILAVLIAALAGAGCGSGRSSPEKAETITFLENDSSFAGFVGGSFSMNLLFRTPPGTVAPTVRTVRLLPTTSWLEISDISVNENNADGETRRWALGLTARGVAPGSADFAEIELETAGGRIRAALGSIRVDVVEGESAGLFALFTSGGVHPEPMPFEFSVENPTDEPVVLSDVLLDHPRIHYEKSDIVVAGAALGDAGYPLEPGAKVDVAVRWTVDDPGGPVNLEARPLLVVDRGSHTRYTGLHNLVVRKDPALAG